MACIALCAAVPGFVYNVGTLDSVWQPLVQPVSGFQPCATGGRTQCCDYIVTLRKQT